MVDWLRVGHSLRRVDLEHSDELGDMADGTEVVRDKQVDFETLAGVSGILVGLGMTRFEQAVPAVASAHRPVWPRQAAHFQKLKNRYI